MGKKLFRRQNQILTLNDDGQALYDSVAPALEHLADAVNAHFDDSRNIRLRLGVLPLFASQRLFPHLPELRRLYPALHIDTVTTGHSENYLGDTLDAAIIITDHVDPALYSDRLDHNFVYAITSRELARTIGDTPDAEILAKQTFLIHSDMPASFESWKAALGLDGLVPTAIDHFDSGPLMLEAAAQGLGIAILHDDHLSRSSDDRLAQLYDIKVESPYSYWFVCKPRALETRPVRLFHDWLMKTEI